VSIPSSEPTRFLILGAGAIGSVFAVRLASRHPVAVVARGERLRQILRDGIRVKGATEGTIAPPAAATAEALAAFRPDFALVTVKAHATGSAVRSLDPLGTRPIRVSLQNGLGNEETLAAGNYPVIGGVSNNGATLLESGEVFHAGLGDVIVSAFQNVAEETVARLAGDLSAAGFSVQQVPDIRKPLWDKTILNAALNPVSALLGVRTGQLLRDSGSERLLRLLLREAVAVARAEGISTSEAEVWAIVQRIVARTSGNKTSMLQDLERGVRTEIEAMNGVIVRRGSQHGIETPWNRLMLRLIRSRERG
jgi:2-dehydropantoate 2-reductase